MMPEKSESIYEPYRSIREMQEGQTAQQCEPASDGDHDYILESIEREIRAAQSARAEKQSQLEELQREYRGSFSVLQNAQASERDKEAAFLLCDEIDKDIKTMVRDIAILTELLEKLEREHVVIPESVYREGMKPQGGSSKTSRETRPFNFSKSK